MGALLAVSRGIDRLNRAIGRASAWLVVAAILISAGNALIRKLPDTISSNAWLELQWWLFASVFLLAAPWTLASNEHVRIDIVSNHLPRPLRSAIEVIGHALFLLPLAVLMVWLAWPFFLASYAQNEQSLNAGGLPQWPAKLLIPIGFALLALQGVSELVKRIAIVRGLLTEESGAGAHAILAGPHGQAGGPPGHADE
ncbi:MAG: TRAP transporter small permease subunit [Pseudomonadota bacterium]